MGTLVYREVILKQVWCKKAVSNTNTLIQKSQTTV